MKGILAIAILGIGVWLITKQKPSVVDAVGKFEYAEKM